MAGAVVEVISGPDGTPVACKRSAATDVVARLRHEAAVLEELAHPGLVAPHGLVADGVDVRLLTRWVSGGTLADALPLPRGRALRILAGVATTTAELHARAVVHGALHPEHVLLDGGDNPVLCSLGRCGPAAPDTVALDVAALGALIEQALQRPALESLRRGTHRTLDWDLVALAARALDPDPGARPAAATLAAALQGALEREVVPPPTSPPGTAATRPQRWPGPLRPPAWARRPAAVAGAAATVVLVTLLVLTTAVGGDASPTSDAPGDVAAAPPDPAPTTDTVAPGRATTTTAPRSTTVAPASPGTTAAVVVEGTQLTLADGRRFTVGDPGDEVAVGDWDCDGTATAAVLRPDTGEVFVFDHWPDGESAAVRPSAVVPGATTFDPQPAQAGCGHLVVHDPVSGRREHVR